METNKEQISSLLQRFQEGYQERNLKETRRFFEELFVQDLGVLVIGTSAFYYDDAEWCQGPEKIIALIEDDWKNWGALILDVKGARITLETPEIASVVMIGKVSKEKANYRCKEDTYDSNKEDNLYKNNWDFWPLVVSMLVIKVNKSWKFKQIHFSYPRNLFSS